VEDPKGAEREELLRLARRRKSAQAAALRARIVLVCAGGAENNAVAGQLGVTKQTVSRWRGRFVKLRVDGLLDAPRSGAPRTIEDDRVEAVIAKTLESMPTGATHWSTRLMAREMGMSQNAILRIWHAFGLRPHRQETFKLSTDPMFVQKVRDIVGLYMNPRLMAMVLCVDEKTQIQALAHAADAAVSPGAARGIDRPALQRPHHSRAGAGDRSLGNRRVGGQAAPRAGSNAEQCRQSLTARHGQVEPTTTVRSTEPPVVRM
jgi:transposase